MSNFSKISISRELSGFLDTPTEKHSYAIISVHGIETNDKTESINIILIVRKPSLSGTYEPPESY